MSNVSKIFWPSNLTKKHLQPGFLVGWNVRGLAMCVATLVSGVELEQVLQNLNCLLSDENCDSSVINMKKVCQVKPTVLGVLLSTKVDLKSGISKPEIKKDGSLWIIAELTEFFIPTIRSVHCLNQELQIQTEIIFFNPPDPFNLQHLSLQPLNLDITVAEAVPVVEGESFVEQEKIQSKNFDYLQKIDLHTKFTSSSKEKIDYELETILQQINCVHDLHRKIQSFNDSHLRVNAVFQFFYRFTESIFISSFIKRAIQITSWPIIISIIVARLLAEVCLTIFNWKLKPYWLFSGLPLKDLSMTIQQVDLRLQQMCFWPYQWRLFLADGWRYSLKNRAQYVNFYNTMWLIANDVIIGIAIGTFLINHNQEVSDYIYGIVSVSINSIKTTIVWLMGWPAGLKLNHQLDKFLGELFIWLIYVWMLVMENFGPYLPILLKSIGFCGIFGASMVLSMLCDLLSILSLHVYLFYSVAAKIYNWQLNSLWSLFNLFRGKKYNVLRKRLDSCDYDLDQLLLGTILFTLLFFLFPTVLVYYVLFCVAHVVVMACQIILRTVLSFLNHFPLFALMIRIKDPKRLPGGIKVKIVPTAVLQQRSILSKFRMSIYYYFQGNSKIDFNKNKDNQGPKVTYLLIEVRIVYSLLKVKNVPIKTSAIFFQYILLWKRLTSRYLNFQVLKGLILGEPIKPVPLLQYPMVPEKRPDLVSFWLFLKDSFNI